VHGPALRALRVEPDDGIAHPTTLPRRRV
jgi:hypothetical protein